MDDIAIKAQGLGKRYRVGELKKYKALRDTLNDVLSAPFTFAGAIVRGRRRADEQPAVDGHIWAIKDISFQVKRGEVVGIIGRNGAGKSTLLKVLARITEPTEGQATTWGQMGSLLEVGTGFHPELTGRENIYLNGAIMGMKKAELDSKIDEIIAFAEIERFIDTPVKHYSSGMYLRIAFSVAAHLEPEILLVDEVLAVGDAEFQKKCLGKMGEVAKVGRTVLLVSHNMEAINHLCPRTIWIDDGRIRQDGPTHEVVASYLGNQVVTGGEYVPTEKEAGLETADLSIRGVRLRNADGHITGTLDATKAISIEIDYEVRKKSPFAWVGFSVSTNSGMMVLAAADADIESFAMTPRITGIHTSRCNIPANVLNLGAYVLSVRAAKPIGGSNEIICDLEDILAFEIENSGGKGIHMPGPRGGVISPKLDWEIISNQRGDSTSRGMQDTPVQGHLRQSAVEIQDRTSR